MGSLAPCISTVMKISTPSSNPVEPLVGVRVYMYPAQRQRLREQAVRRGMAMSEYLKWLIDRDHRGGLGGER
jgi:hypothetical protein